MTHSFLLLGFIFLAIFTPLAFATTEGWAVAVFELVLLLLLLVYMLDRARSGLLWVHHPDLLFILLLFTLFVFFQAMPLPAGFLRLEFLGVPRTTFSLYPYATLNAAMKVLSYWVVFFLAMHFFSPCAAGYGKSGEVATSRLPVLRFVHFLVFFAFALSVFALFQHFTSNGKIYWFKDLTFGGSPFGPFVNRNHYAGYMEMTIPLVLGLLFAKGIRNDQWPLYLFISVIMAASLFFSLSRSGMFTFVGQLLALVFLVSKARGDRRIPGGNLWVLGTFIVMLLASLFFLGPGAVVSRIGTVAPNDPTPLSPGRVDVWHDTMRIFQSFPAVGSGLGTFPILHTIYKSRPTDSVYLEAHNDYLQILAETGIIGTVLLLIFGVGVLWRGLNNLWREHNRTLIGIRAGALTGCLGILLHSLTDFNLQIPANASLFFILAGLSIMPSISAGASQDEEILRQSYIIKRGRASSRDKIPAAIGPVPISAAER